MKRILTAVAAALIAVAMPAFAADKPAPETMSKADCQKAWNACADDACRNELLSKGCEKPKM